MALLDDEVSPIPSLPQPSAISKLIAKSGAKTTAEALPLEILHNLRHQHGWKDLQLHTISPSNVSTLATPLSISDISASALTSSTPLSSASSTPTLRALRSPNRSPVRSLSSHHPLREVSSYNDNNTSTSSLSSVSTVTPSTPDLQHRPITLISGLPPRHIYLHPDFQNSLLKNKIDPSKNADAIPIAREWVLAVSLGEKWSLSKICAVFDSLPDRDLIRVDDSSGRQGRQIQWQDAKRVVMGMLAHNGFGGDGTIAYYIVQEGEVKPRQNG